MDKFLDTYTFPRPNQEKVKTLNRPATGSEVVEAINSLPMKKVHDHMESQPNSTRDVKRSWYHSFSNDCKQWKKGILPNSFYETSIILIPKPSRDTTKKENIRPIAQMNIDVKIINKILANRI